LDVRTFLQPINGEAPIEVDRDLLLVGRQEGCDLLLDHKTVSKAHCVLCRSEGKLLLRDLGSTNGCRVNGQRIQRGALWPNDILSIAVFEYRVVLTDQAPIAAPAAKASDHTEIIDHLEEMKEADD
jgi:pSer/pThr/pTyr-binding forkhead associated (FHA) protein